MKLQILSDGSMVLDGDAVGLAEFAKAMRVTTTVATSVDTTVATTVAAASAPVESNPESNIAPKPAHKPVPRVRTIPADPIPSVVPTSEASSRLLSAMSSEEGRTLSAIAEVSGLGTVQARNLLNRLRERGHVVSDGGSPELWLRAVNVKVPPSVKPESTTATKTSADRAAKGANREFVMNFCEGRWVRRREILIAAKEAGVNPKSVEASLADMVRQKQLTYRRCDGLGQYTTTATPATTPSSTS